MAQSESLLTRLSTVLSDVIKLWAAYDSNWRQTYYHRQDFVYHYIDRKSAIDIFLDSSNNRTLTPEEESWVREQTNELPLDLRQAHRHNSQLPDMLRLYSSGSSEPFYDQITGSQLNERHQRLRAVIEIIAAASPEHVNSIADSLADEILSETPGSITST